MPLHKEDYMTKDGKIKSTSSRNDFFIKLHTSFDKEYYEELE